MMRACVPLTPLGQGQLWFLVSNDESGIGVTMANRAMTEDEWAMYCASPISARKRRPKSRKQIWDEQLAAEAEGGRISDEKMQELVRNGQNRVIL